MLYLYYCRDGQTSKERRLEHLTFVENNMKQLKVAGPLSKEGNAPYSGSLYIIDAQSQQSADLLFETDPYYKADIWSSVERHCFNAFAGDWVGGKNW